MRWWVADSQCCEIKCRFCFIRTVSRWRKTTDSENVHINVADFMSVMNGWSDHTQNIQVWLTDSQTVTTKSDHHHSSRCFWSPPACCEIERSLCARAAPAKTSIILLRRPSRFNRSLLIEPSRLEAIWVGRPAMQSAADVCRRSHNIIVFGGRRCL